MGTDDASGGARDSYGVAAAGFLGEKDGVGSDRRLSAGAEELRPRDRIDLEALLTGMVPAWWSEARRWVNSIGVGRR